MPECVGWFLTIFGLFLVALFGVTMMGVAPVSFGRPLSRMWWIIKLINFLAVASSMMVIHLGYTILIGSNDISIPTGRYIAITVVITFFWVVFRFCQYIFANLDDPNLFFPP